MVRNDQNDFVLAASPTAEGKRRRNRAVLRAARSPCVARRRRWQRWRIFLERKFLHLYATSLSSSSPSISSSAARTAAAQFGTLMSAAGSRST